MTLVLQLLMTLLMTNFAISDYVFQSSELSELTLYCDMYGPCSCAGKGKHWSVHQDLALMKQFMLQSGQKFWYKIKKVLKNRTVDSIRNRGLLLLGYLSSESRYNTHSQLMRVKLFIERIEQILFNHKEQCKQKIKKLKKDIEQKSKIIEELKNMRREMRNQPLQFDQTIQKLSKCYENSAQLHKKQKKPQKISSVTTSHPYYYDNIGDMQDQILQQKISQMEHHSMQSQQHVHVHQNYQFDEEMNYQIIPKIQCNFNESNSNNQIEEQKKQQQRNYSYKYDLSSSYIPFEQKLSDNELEQGRNDINNSYIQEKQYPIQSKKQKNKKKTNKKQQKNSSQSKIQLEQRIKKQIYKQMIKQKLQARLDKKDKQQLVNFQPQINRCNKIQDVNEHSHNYNLIKCKKQKNEKQKAQPKNKVIPNKSQNGKRLLKEAPNYHQFLKKYLQLHQQGEQDQIYNLSWQQIKNGVDL